MNAIVHSLSLYGAAAPFVNEIQEPEVSILNLWTSGTFGIWSFWYLMLLVFDAFGI
jgi:hypothetical protein